MKIISNDGVYVQVIDVINLINSNLDLPASVYQEIINNSADLKYSQKFDFIKFQDCEVREFLENCKWIFNYDFYNSKSLLYFKILELQLKKELRTCENKLISVSFFEMVRLNDIHEKILYLKLMLSSVRIAIYCKKENVKFKCLNDINKLIRKNKKENVS